MSYILNITVRTKLIIAFTTMTLLFSAMVLIYFPSKQKQQLKISFTNELNTTAKAVAQEVAIGMSTGNLGVIGQVFEMAKTNKNILYIFIFNRSGKVIAKYNPMEVKTDLDELLKIGKPTLFENSLNAKEAITLENKEFGHAIVGFDFDFVKNASRGIMSVSIIFALVMGLLGLIASAVIGKWFKNSIAKILSTAEEIGKGKLNCQDLKVSNLKNEFDRLSRAINEMKSQLSAMFLNIQNCNDILFASSEEMASHSTAMLEGVNEISSQNTYVASAVEESSTNMETISENTNIMSEEITSVSHAISEMNKSLIEVASNCSQESRITDEAKQQIHSGQTKLKQLTEATSKITQVVNAIQSIAEKTNLLALNATIEAASAGDAGKGFSVVAGEVKALALQSASAADEIRQIVELILVEGKGSEQIFDAVAETINNINIISHNISASTEEQSSTLTGITETMGKVNNSSQQITKNVMEAASGLNEVSKTIKEVYSACLQTKEGANLNKEKGDILKAQAEEMKSFLKRFEVS